MRRIYQQTKRANYREPFVQVQAWFPEELGLPALIQVVKGHYDSGVQNDRIDSCDWIMLPPPANEILHEWEAIRKAIAVLDAEVRP